MKNLITLLMLIITLQANAQLGINKNTLSAEFLGHSLNYISLNYDRIIKPTKSNWVNYSVGLSLSQADDESHFAVSNSINYTHGKKRSHLELGCGLGYKQITKRLLKAQRLLLLGRLGYKYQRRQGGLFLRVGLTPNIPVIKSRYPCFGFFCEIDMVVHWAGLSIGYTF